MYPYCRIYQKQYTCPTLVLGQAKTMAKNSFRNRNFRQIKWRIVITPMCILWGGIKLWIQGFASAAAVSFAAGFDLFSSIFWSLEFVFISGREELLQVGG
jgi:hypothetical protein